MGRGRAASQDVENSKRVLNLFAFSVLRKPGKCSAFLFLPPRSLVYALSLGAVGENGCELGLICSKTEQKNQTQTRLSLFFVFLSAVISRQ